MSPFSHPWDVTPAHARAIQIEGRAHVIAADRPGAVRRVLASDVARFVAQRAKDLADAGVHMRVN